MKGITTIKGHVIQNNYYNPVDIHAAYHILLDDSTYARIGEISPAAYDLLMKCPTITGLEIVEEVIE